ncbi:hypothetical protein J6590_062373 [Homalodisca vitripennis]|nr:hypothetical protein J6590_062373 [Homalodisca vitripennis]
MPTILVAISLLTKNVTITYTYSNTVQMDGSGRDGRQLPSLSAGVVCSCEARPRRDMLRYSITILLLAQDFAIMYTWTEVDVTDDSYHRYQPVSSAVEQTPHTNTVQMDGSGHDGRQLPSLSAGVVCSCEARPRRDMLRYSITILLLTQDFAIMYTYTNTVQMDGSGHDGRQLPSLSAGVVCSCETRPRRDILRYSITILLLTQDFAIMYTYTNTIQMDGSGHDGRQLPSLSAGVVCSCETRPRRDMPRLT